MSEILAGDIVWHHGRDEALRVERVHRDGRLRVRRYGGDRRPLGAIDRKDVEPSALVTLLLDPFDAARLQEMRRLVGLVNRPGDLWGPTSPMLAAYLRWAIRNAVSLWRDDRVWEEILAEYRWDIRRVARASNEKWMRVRMPVSLRAGLQDVADAMRWTVDDVARAAVAEQLSVLIDVGTFALEELSPGKRLCTYAPGMLRLFDGAGMAVEDDDVHDVVEASTAAPEPAPELVSVDILEEMRIERR